MKALRRVYHWACRGPLSYVTVVGLLSYGVPLGVVLTGYMVWLHRLPLALALAVAFALALLAGLIFGAGMWVSKGRHVGKVVHE